MGNAKWWGVGGEAPAGRQADGQVEPLRRIIIIGGVVAHDFLVCFGDDRGV